MVLGQNKSGKTLEKSEMKEMPQNTRELNLILWKDLQTRGATAYPSPGGHRLSLQGCAGCWVLGAEWAPETTLDAQDTCCF